MTYMEVNEMSRRFVQYFGPVSKTMFEKREFKRSDMRSDKIPIVSVAVMVMETVAVLDRDYHYLVAQYICKEPQEVKVIPTYEKNASLVMIPVHKGADKVDPWTYTDMISQIHRLFGLSNGVYPIDGFINCGGADMAYVSASATDTPRGTSVPYFSFEPENHHISEKNPKDIVRDLIYDTEMNRMTYLAMLSQSYARFIYPNQKAFYDRMMPKFLAPTMIRRFRETSRVIYRCIDTETFASNRTHPKGKKVAWGSMISDKKRVANTLEIYSNAFALGFIDNVVCAHQGSERDDVLTDAFPKGEHHWNLGPHEYVSAFKECRCFVSSQTLAGFGGSNLDMMAAGIIGLYPANCGYEKILPLGYPFLYKNREEAVSMIKTLMNNDKLFEVWSEQLVIFMQAVFSTKEVREELYAWMDGCYEDFSKTGDASPYWKKRSIGENKKMAEAVKLLHKGNTWTFSQFTQALKKEKMWPARGPDGRVWFTQADWYRLMIDQGFVDSIDSAEPILRITRS